jgi:hypothetical protein
MKKCLACKTKMETSKFEEYGECQECGSTEVIELEEYNYFRNLKGKMVLSLGSEHKEPVYCILKALNKYGWFVLDVINTTSTIFGTSETVVEINEENLKLFERNKIQYQLDFHKKLVEKFEKQLSEFN